MEINKEDITLAILNITSWAGLCADADHVYGKLILSSKPDVNIDNVEEWNVNYLGNDIEICQPLTMEIAKKLDAKGGGKHYQRIVILIAENPGEFDDRVDYGKTNRFNSFDEVEKFAIAKWKELDLKCPFITLYEGEKYDFTDIYTGEKCITKILYPD